MNKLVVFDLDGTLADTAATLAESMNRVIEHLGGEAIPKETVIAFVGSGVRVLAKLSLEYRGLPSDQVSLDAAVDLFYRFYAENCTDAEAYEGVGHILAELEKCGVLLGVYSNKPHRFVKPICDALFGEDTFLFAVGQTDRPIKPDPTVLLELIEVAGATPESTVYVGDSDVDIKTARNSGTHLSMLSWGYRPARLLWETGADFVTDSPEELLLDIKKKLNIKI